MWAEGWDHFDGFYQQNGAYYDYQRITYDRVSDPTATTSTSGGYSTKVFGRSLVEWLRGLDGSKPFFAYYAPYAPHAGRGISGPYEGLFEDARPFRSPAIGEDTSDKPTYIRMHPMSGEARRGQQDLRILQLEALRGVDVQVGNILDQLGSAGQLGKTIVLFTSDNGAMWGEHDRRGKLVPYERSVRVPMILMGPGVPAGQQSPDLVSNVDVARTIYDLTGVAGPSNDGLNMLAGDRATLLLEGMRLLDPLMPTYCGIVTASGYKYVAYVTDVTDPAAFEDELYDLDEDPHELENVVTSRIALRDNLRSKLATLCDLPGPDLAPVGWESSWS